RAAIRAFSASFSSRASRAISLTASNSSRCTTSRSRRMRSAWLRNKVSNSRRTPCATPAASFIRRAISSKKRLLVWVMPHLRRRTVIRMAIRSCRRKSRHATKYGALRFANRTSHAFARHTLPGVRPRSGASRPLRHPLVRPRLHRRYPARLVVRPHPYPLRKIVGRQGAPDGGRLRRFHPLGGARHHSRRTHRLRPLLQSSPFRLAPAGNFPVVERRHVIPWRLHGLRDCCGGVWLYERDSGAFAGRPYVRRWPDRIVSRPHCEFHQRRIVGTTGGRPLGDGL